MAKISREDLLAELRKIPNYRDEENDVLVSLRDVCAIVDRIPDAEVHAVWEDASYDSTGGHYAVQCSNCCHRMWIPHGSTPDSQQLKYCTVCGAKMDGNAE